MHCSNTALVVLAVVLCTTSPALSAPLNRPFPGLPFAFRPLSINRIPVNLTPFPFPSPPSASPTVSTTTSVNVVPSPTPLRAVGFLPIHPPGGSQRREVDELLELFAREDESSMLSRREFEDIIELVARAISDEGDLESGASFLGAAKNFINKHGEALGGAASIVNLVTSVLPALTKPAAPAPAPPPPAPAVVQPAPAPAAPQPAHKRGEFDVGTMLSRRDVEDLFELVARAVSDDTDLESGASFLGKLGQAITKHGDTITGVTSGINLLSGILPAFTKPAPPPPPPAVAQPAPAPAAPQPARKRGEFDVDTMLSRRDVEDIFELVARAVSDDTDLESGASFLGKLGQAITKHGDTITGVTSGLNLLSGILPAFTKPAPPPPPPAPVQPAPVPPAAAQLPPAARSLNELD